MYEQNFEL